MLHGPFDPASIRWHRWREAPDNSFLLADGELLWKVGFNERQPVFIPLSGKAPFVDRNWTPTEMGGPGAALPIGGIKVRLGTPRSLLPGGMNPWPLGHMVLTRTGELALAIKTHLFDATPRDYLIALSTGRPVFDWDDGSRVLCFDQWELIGKVAPAEETVLARLGPVEGA